jgi:hypothetical protein
MTVTRNCSKIGVLDFPSTLNHPANSDTCPVWLTHGGDGTLEPGLPGVQKPS